MKIDLIIPPPDEANPLIYKKYCSDVKNFLAVLEDDFYFENQINDIRNRYKIRPSRESKGYLGFDELSARYINEFNKELEKPPYTGHMFGYINQLCDEYDFPVPWRVSVYSLIKWDYFVAYPYTSFIYLLTGDQLLKDIKSDSNELRGTKNHVYIQITNGVSYKDLEMYIKWLYPMIQSKFDEPNELDNGFPLKIKCKNLKVYKRIFDLVNRHKKKSADVANILLDEFDRVCSDSDIRVMLGRYENIIGRLRANSRVKAKKSFEDSYIL